MVIRPKKENYKEKCKYVRHHDPGLSFGATKLGVLGVAWQQPKKI